MRPFSSASSDPARPLSVVVLDWVLEPGKPGASGLSDISWELGRALRALGDDVAILGAYERWAPRPDGDLRLYLMDRPKAWRRNVLGQLATCFALSRALHNLPTADVVFAPEYLAAAVVALMHPGLPVVFTTPGNIYERIQHGNPYDWATTQVYKWAARTASRRAARVIALSEHMRQWWKRTGAPEERIAVLPLGVDAALFRPHASARAQLGIPATEETILYGGRFSVEKNLPTLLNAVARLAPDRPELRLRLLGGGPAEPELRKLVRELGLEERVHFGGWAERATMPLHFSAADVVALPSTSEPLARVLLESMACGAFPVASSAGGTPDVVQHEVNGLLVEALDVDAWHRSLARALDDPSWRRRLAARASKKVRAEFDWAPISRRLRTEVLEPVVREARARRRPVPAPPGRGLADPIFLVDYVLDVQRPGASGLSDVVWDMATELDRQGIEAHVFGTYDRVPRSGHGVVLHPVRLPPAGYRNVVGYVAIVLSVYREILRFGRPGIIHAPEYLSTGLLALLSRRSPVVLTVPGSIHEKIALGTNAYDPTMTLALRLCARLSARFCARVVATSADMERWWGWVGTPRRRLVRLPLGVSTERFAPRPGARGRLGWDRDRLILLNVGRVNRENGLTSLIDAMPAVRRHEPRVELHLVGDGPDLASLKRRAEEVGVADSIRWHGWVDTSQLADFYSAADLFVFCALAAGLPRVVLEAMACATPVLATRVSGVTDHVVEGRTGYLASPGSAQSIEAGIIRALTDPGSRQRLGEAGRNRVLSTMSWQTIVAETIERVYRPLAVGAAREA